MRCGRRRSSDQVFKTIVASGSRPAPETPLNQRASSARCAVTSRLTLAAGSRAARRSSATPTSDQRRVGGLCDPECLLPDSTTRRSSRSRGAPRPDAPPTTGFWLPFSGEVRREGRTRALPCNTLEQGRYEIWGHYGTTPTSIPAAHEHGSPRFGASIGRTTTMSCSRMRKPLCRLHRTKQIWITW